MILWTATVSIFGSKRAASGYVGTNNSQGYLLCFQGASMAGAVTTFQARSQAWPRRVFQG